MANIDAPRGLRPVKHLDGSPYNGSFNRYYVPASDSTAIFVGDAVVSGGSADANGVADVAQASAGGNLRGVVIGVEPVTDESLSYRPASTAGYVYVVDAPDVIFEVQEDSVGGAIAVTAVGLNADITVGAGSTVTGTSAMELDSSDVKSGAAQLRIMGLTQIEGNAIGANANWLVLINEHELKSTTGV